MVRVDLPRKVKGSELLDLLEESAKELKYETERDNRGGYAIVPGSVKEELRSATLDIKAIRHSAPNWFGQLLERIFGPYVDFTCNASVDLDGDYATAHMNLMSGWGEVVKTGTVGYAQIREEFEKLIDRLYTKLISPKTQESVNPT